MPRYNENDISQGKNKIIIYLWLKYYPVFRCNFSGNICGSYNKYKSKQIEVNITDHLSRIKL